MLILKIALGVFVGALGALLAYDTISAYRLQRMVVDAQFPKDRLIPEPHASRVREMVMPAKPASQAGVIEWSGKPDSRVTVPR